jgi:uncharacterized protein (DUF1697 family)
MATRYLSLLRGINVGGKNLIRMAELRAAYEEIGLDEVQSYIQSGNVLFSAPRQKREPLAARLETELSRRFGTELKVVLLTAAELGRLIEAAPAGFGAETHKCDVIFLRKPLTVKRALAVVELREGVDSVWPGRGVLYHSRLAARASGSRLSRLVATPEYRNMTIRSWSTTRKLGALLGPSGPA